MPFADLTGLRFGRLVIRELSPVSTRRNKRWHAVCDCGAERVVRTDSVLKGRTKSCGCFRRDLRASHPAPKLAGILAALSGGADTATTIALAGAASTAGRAHAMLQYAEERGYVKRAGVRRDDVPRLSTQARRLTLRMDVNTWALTPAGVEALAARQARRSA